MLHDDVKLFMGHAEGASNSRNRKPLSSSRRHHNNHHYHSMRWDCHGATEDNCAVKTSHLYVTVHVNVVKAWLVQSLTVNPPPLPLHRAISFNLSVFFPLLSSEVWIRTGTCVGRHVKPSKELSVLRTYNKASKSLIVGIILPFVWDVK